MTHEAKFRTIFPAKKGDKKGTKRRTKYLVSVLMRCLRHLDGIPKKKWPVSRQLPFKNEPEIFWLVGFLHISLDEKSQDIVSFFREQIQQMQKKSEMQRSLFSLA